MNYDYKSYMYHVKDFKSNLTKKCMFCPIFRAHILITKNSISTFIMVTNFKWTYILKLYLVR